MNPYVVTEDLEFLMECWAAKAGIKIPSHQFFCELQDELMEYLSVIFSDLELIKHADLSSRLKKKINNLPYDKASVSLDRVYGKGNYNLEINRVADFRSLKLLGLAERPGSLALAEQLAKLPNSVEITVIDDGCFSGGTLGDVIWLMKAYGLKVNQCIVGIMINRKNNLLVKSNPDFIIESVYEFDGVIDWLCERDFFIGVPLSGKTVGFSQAGLVKPLFPDVVLPYCRPFGDPIKSASIPEFWADEYSRFIISLSCKLWAEIERQNGKIYYNSDIPRLPHGLRRDKCRFIEVLARIKNRL